MSAMNQMLTAVSLDVVTMVKFVKIQMVIIHVNAFLLLTVLEFVYVCKIEKSLIPFYFINNDFFLSDNQSLCNPITDQNTCTINNDTVCLHNTVNITGTCQRKYTG